MTLNKISSSSSSDSRVVEQIMDGGQVKRCEGEGVRI